MSAGRLARLAAPLLIAACATTPIAEGPPSPLLAGRVTGAPISCLNQRLITDQRVVNDHTILFRAGKWYRNDLRRACNGLDDRKTLIIRTTTGYTCDGDIASVVDLPSNFSYGFCPLGKFTPYELPPGVR